MASTLCQAKEMFHSIDSENTGLIPREELKILMQEIGGDIWAGDNFATMLEACGVEPGSGDVKYSAFLEQVLGSEEEKSEKGPIEAESAAPAPGAPSVQDWADAAELVEVVCDQEMASIQLEKSIRNESKQRPSLLPLAVELDVFGEEHGDQPPDSASPVLPAIADPDAWVANETRSMRLRGEFYPLTISSRRGELLFELPSVCVSVRIAEAEFDSLCPRDAGPAAIDSCIGDMLEKALAASEAEALTASEAEAPP